MEKRFYLLVVGGEGVFIRSTIVCSHLGFVMSFSVWNLTWISSFFVSFFSSAYEHAVDVLDKTYVPLFHQSEEVS